MNTPFPLDGIAPLSDRGVLRARGADAARFLHGQLTSDVLQLDPAQARLTGFCSAKGRLQASFVMWRSGPEEILLVCATSVLPATLKRLSMFVLRAQCRLADAGSEVALFGLAGATAARWLGDAAVWERRAHAGQTVIRLPDAQGVPRALLAASSAPVGLPVLPLPAWHWLEVQSGVPTIEVATIDQFVPQMLNYELLGGVDFKKGCYPGQEIVARSQYRGTLKRRTFLFDVQDAGARAGQEVFHSADPGQPAGMVVNAAPQPSGAGSSLLAEVKLLTLEGGTLHLGSVDGALLTRRELPYRVPFESAEAA